MLAHAIKSLLGPRDLSQLRCPALCLPSGVKKVAESANARAATPAARHPDKLRCPSQHSQHPESSSSANASRAASPRTRVHVGKGFRSKPTIAISPLGGAKPSQKKNRSLDSLAGVMYLEKNPKEDLLQKTEKPKQDSRLLRLCLPSLRLLESKRTCIFYSLFFFLSFLFFFFSSMVAQLFSLHRAVGACIVARSDLFSQ
jgi:hypothetical protein